MNIEKLPTRSTWSFMYDEFLSFCFIYPYIDMLKGKSNLQVDTKQSSATFRSELSAVLTQTFILNFYSYYSNMHKRY